MFQIKFIVLLLFFNKYYCLEINYCEICYNHTLCKFKNAGPSEVCMGYDLSAVLTRHEIEAIVNKINDRRNLVASGRGRRAALPPAANIMKLVWSEELAFMAQRWVDQCDPKLQPDLRDVCRDLVDIQVGQNIATVMGLSPGLSVKSFIDIWFMQSMDYPGSVSYYNQSVDGGTDYFTQLIWADTTEVGCGRARFYIQGSMPIDRLVCNFASKGNIHSRPVYSIGFPATQCPAGAFPDAKYTSLCARPNLATKIHTKLTVSSLIRKLNLTNSSVTRKIDPIQHNIRNVKPHRIERNQKTRHVNNRTNYAMPAGVYPVHNKWNTETDYPHKVFSLIHHDHITRNKPSEPNTGKDYRRFFRKCTRKSKSSPQDGQVTDECTRDPNYEDSVSQTSQKSTPSLPTQQNTCTCYKPTSQLTTSPPTKCTCNENCQCLYVNQRRSYFPTRYPSILRIQENSDRNELHKMPDSYYYNQYHDSTLRNENYNMGSTIKRLFSKSYIRNNDRYASDKFLTNDENYHNVLQNSAVENSGLISLLQPRHPKSIYMNHRYKRDSEDGLQTKPFWELEGFHPKSPQLKSLRYTTLTDRRSLRNKRPKSVLVTQTEPITFQYKDSPRTKEHRQRQPVKEKYLSFDELMNLRRNNEGDFDYGDIRRQNKYLRDGATNTTASGTTASTVTTAATTVVTMNTYPRIKHCTRKLTCTWTAPTVSGKGIILPGGSKTPPGYVDGCTRTSTCSRVYMDRNLLLTPQSEDSETNEGDEDYCERRSLNRRDSDPNKDDDDASAVENYSEFPEFTESYLYADIDSSTESSLTIRRSEDATNDDEADCVCKADTQRAKRVALINNVSEEELEKRIIRNNKEILTYGNLYYDIMNKILKTRKKQCSTNHLCRYLQ